MTGQDQCFEGVAIRTVASAEPYSTGRPRCAPSRPKIFTRSMTVPGIQEHKANPAKSTGRAGLSMAAGGDVRSVDALNQAARSTTRCLIRSQWWTVSCVKAQTSTIGHVEFWRVSVLSLLDYTFVESVLSKKRKENSFFVGHGSRSFDSISQVEN